MRRLPIAFVFASLAGLLMAAPAAAQVLDEEPAEREPAQEAEGAAEQDAEAGAQEEQSDEEDEEPKVDAGLLSGLKLRSIGPALMSGRIADVVVDPVTPNVWYVAAGSGGVWKTTDAGTTFRPIFDGQSSYSIGCLTLDPSDHDVLWVGTGEAVGGRHVAFGDGVYRSRDGGGSFEHLGLKESEHVGKIVVHPEDGDVVYVAAQGPLWSPGGQRGLYRTTDGGENWEEILCSAFELGPYTGVTDVVMDPRDPDVLYAATHQRHRTVAALINGGPETGIYKSEDGGESWRELRRGLPGGDMGKIALAVSPQKPDVVYATIELAGGEGGFWRSENGGERWSKRSDYVSGGTGPHYYQELWADPHRFDVLYQANVVLGRTEDGGRTWDGMRNRNKHVDNHALAFHPTDPDFLLVGCDGGLYASWDRGEHYRFYENLPLTQFYKVDVSYEAPVYHVVGGTQDNNTQYGPVRTLNRNGIRNSDWRILIGGDGHDCAIDPENPNIVYCESQQGYLQRVDMLSGESVSIRPQPGPGEDYFRFNWDSPIHISPHDSKRLYFGSKMLHRSDDRGDTWTAVSGDLSRGEDRLTLEVMGRVWSVDALWDLGAMSKYGNVTSISESPLVEGLIYVGTDDGLIQITEDGGETWTAVDEMGGVPDYAFVNDVKAGRHDPDVVYAALDHHKSGDFSPYLMKSTDRGRTWTSISGDLPDRHLVWRVIQDHVDPDLLFAGTEFGVFCTVDGGESWIELRGGVPTISFRDLEIQRAEDDLVGATFGRGFYVLDDYGPLRHLDEELLAQEFAFLPAKPAEMYLPDDELGGRHGSQGDHHFSADNPPYGAVLTYHLRESLRTLEQERRKKEREVKKEGGDNPYPGWDALESEEREEDPSLFFEVRTPDGLVVNRFRGPTSKGLHRVTWNLRYAGFSPGRGRGPLAVPGTYVVQAYQRHRSETRALGDPLEIEVVNVAEFALPPQDRAATLAFQEELGELQQVVVATRRALGEAGDQLEEMRRAILGGRRAELALLDQVRRLELEVLDAQELLTGDDTRTSRGHEGAPSIQSRLSNALWGTLGQSYGPTGAHREQAAIARRALDRTMGDLRSLVEEEIPALGRMLNEAGVVWTAGRPIPDLPQ